MRPVTNLAAAALLSATLMLGGGWVSSLLSPSAAPLGSAAEPTHGGLLVEVTGIRSAKGQVVVTVYDTAEAFARYGEDYVDYRLVPAAPGSVVADFPHLVKGPYAVVVFHDEDGDLTFDLDGGMPLEGYGSSGATTPDDAPSFEGAAVFPGEVPVALHYLK